MAGEANYPVSFYFELSFEGEDAAFQEVTGIEKKLELEEVQSGGENRFAYRLPTASKYQNLILKRALVPTGSKLITWCETTIDGDFSAPIKTQDVTLNLLNAKGEPVVGWTFYNAYPVRYAVSDLHSEVSELAIETIELAYTYFKIRNKQ